jgi:NADPH2:quinone reductase
MASGSFAPVSPELAMERKVSVCRISPVSPADNAARARAALAEAAAGRLKPVIGQELELDQAAGAHAAIEARTTVGKTLLAVAR